MHYYIYMAAATTCILIISCVAAWPNAFHLDSLHLVIGNALRAKGGKDMGTWHQDCNRNCAFCISAPSHNLNV